MYFGHARRSLILLTLPLAGAFVAACSEGAENKSLAPFAASGGSESETTDFRVAAPGECGGSHVAGEDTCKGRADGVYCSTLRDFSAIKCEGEQIVLGLQCGDGEKCIGPNGPGSDITCGPDDTPGTDGAPGEDGANPNRAGAQSFKSRFRAATDPLNVYGEECQAEVGLMPEFDCMDFAEIPTMQDGQALTVAGRGATLSIQRNGVAIPGALGAGAEEGQWTPRPRCDNPSWASTPCYPGTRVGLIESNGASWAILCRRQKVQRSDDPNFDLVGVIAHNKKTGGTCFFDKSPGTPPITKTTFPQPGNADAAIQRAAMRIWATPDAGFENCLNCHAAGAFIRSPYVASVALGGAMTADGDYKVLGTAFRRLWGGAAAPKTFEVTDADCSSCHRLGNTRQTLMFASLATGGADIDEKSSNTRLAVVKGARTRWPSGYFMPPRGRRLASLDAWNTAFGAERDALHACIRTPTGKGCAEAAFNFF